MKFDQYHPYFYPVIIGGSILVILLYWLLWRKNARLANWLVFFGVVGLVCSLIDWDYAFRHYFLIQSWHIGGTGG